MPSHREHLWELHVLHIYLRLSQASRGWLSGWVVSRVKLDCDVAIIPAAFFEKVPKEGSRKRTEERDRED